MELSREEANLCYQGLSFLTGPAVVALRQRMQAEVNKPVEVKEEIREDVPVAEPKAERKGRREQGVTNL